MSAEIITKEDLELFRVQLLKEIKELLPAKGHNSKEEVEGYRTRDVRRILGCCYNKVKALRIARKIRTKKVGGTIYYNKDDVRRLVEEGF